MTTAWIVLRQTVLMFLYMGIGALLFHRRLITKEGSRSLANLLLYVVLPCVVVKSFCVDRADKSLTEFLVSLLAAAAVLLLAMAAAHLFFRRSPIDDFGAAFSNAGFMGFPLVTAVLGSDAIFYAAGYVALLNVMQWTYGQALISGDRSFLSSVSVLKNPIVLSLVVGLILFLFQIPLPSLVTDALGTLAGLNTPLAMVILGVYLAQTDILTLFTDPHLYLVSAARLLLIPILTMIALQFLPGRYEAIATTLLIVAGAPVGSNVAVYAQKLGKDYAYAVRIVCLSTILSILTMPFLFFIESLAH